MPRRRARSPDDDQVHVRPPARIRRRHARHADDALLVLREVNRSRAEIRAHVGPLLVPCLGEPFRLREQPLELVPELAQHGLVPIGGAPDRHPAAAVRAPTSR